MDWEMGRSAQTATSVFIYVHFCHEISMIWENIKLFYFESRVRPCLALERPERLFNDLRASEI